MTYIQIFRNLVAILTASEEGENYEKRYLPNDNVDPYNFSLTDSTLSTWCAEIQIPKGKLGRFTMERRLYHSITIVWHTIICGILIECIIWAVCAIPHFFKCIRRKFLDGAPIDIILAYVVFVAVTVRGGISSIV